MDNLRNYPLTVLSSLYPVFFSITLASLFVLNVKTKEISTVVDGDVPAIISIALLISYYLTDWISSTFNASIRADDYSPWKLFLLVLGNLLFCGLIISSSCSPSENYFHYFFIGLYLLFAPAIWNFWAMKSEDDTLKKFAVAKTILGGLLTLGGFLLFIKDSQTITDFKGLIIIVSNLLLLTVVAIRLMRVRYSYNKLSAPVEDENSNEEE